METVNNIINQLIIPLASTVLLGIAGWIGVKLKQHLDEKEKNKTILQVVAICVSAVEQIYKELHGPDKLQKCIEMVTDMLSTRGIEISATDIRILIESVLAEFNNAFEKGEDKQPPVVAGFTPADADTKEPPAEEQAEG